MWRSSVNSTAKRERQNISVQFKTSFYQDRSVFTLSLRIIDERMMAFLTLKQKFLGQVEFVTFNIIFHQELFLKSKLNRT